MSIILALTALLRDEPELSAIALLLWMVELILWSVIFQGQLS